MRILHTVEQYWPGVGGMAEVTRQLSEHLVRHGHDVTVATRAIPGRTQKILNGVKIEEFEISGNAVEGYKWGDVFRYQDFLRHFNADVTAFFAAQQWATDLALPILNEIPGGKVFVPTGFSGLYWPNYRDYFKALPDYMRQFDAHVFLSNDYRDIQFARDHKIQNRHVIPNGASEQEFDDISSPSDLRQRLNIAPDSFLILTVGSHNWQKGHLEAMEIFNRAALKNATLLVIGNNPVNGCEARCVKSSKLAKWGPSVGATKRVRHQYFSALKDLLTGRTIAHRTRKSRIIVKYLSRADTVAAFKEADLFLFPSAIECSPLVLFESAAAGTPFLTSEVGNAREIISWTNAGWLLPTYYNPSHSTIDIESSVPILQRLASDRNELRAAGERGRKAWKERFTWEKISRQYEALYAQVCHDSKGNSATLTQSQAKSPRAVGAAEKALFKGN